MEIETTLKSSESLCRLADRILAGRLRILENWKSRALADNELTILGGLSRREFLDHIPQVLSALDSQMRAQVTDQDHELKQRLQMQKHGLSRWQQGFTISQVVRDWNHLRCSILEEITSIVTETPEWIGEPFATATTVLSDLIAEGVNLSVQKYEEIRQAEAKSHSIDLQNTIKDLQRLCKMQKALYDEASHDLAGHLGVMSHLTGLFGKQDALGRRESLLQQYLHEGFERSMQILQDVRYHSDLEAGDTELGLTTFNASELIEKTLSPYLMIAEEKSLKIEKCGNDSLEVETDPRKLERILQNLMHNALKFTLKGKIQISWDLCDDHEMWQITFQNSGKLSPSRAAVPIGRQIIKASKANPRKVSIDQQNLTNPNEMTYEGKNGTENKPDYTDSDLRNRREGIGLSIAKRLANLLQGRLAVRNDSENLGVIARITLPITYPKT